VETVSGLRVIPNLNVIRPADPEETAGAFAAAFSRQNGPTLLALTRQAVPLLSAISVEDRRNGTMKGGYIAQKETGALHAIAAAKQIGDGVRVVSMPSMFLFEQQSAEYREVVLPSSVRRRVAIEAGVRDLWFRYVGLDGAVIGIDRFGLSAPGNVVMEKLGITAQSVVDAAKALK
jgi:transketolase